MHREAESQKNQVKEILIRKEDVLAPAGMEPADREITVAMNAKKIVRNGQEVITATDDPMVTKGPSPEVVHGPVTGMNRDATGQMGTGPSMKTGTGDPTVTKDPNQGIVHGRETGMNRTVIVRTETNHLVKTDDHLIVPETDPVGKMDNQTGRMPVKAGVEQTGVPMSVRIFGKADGKMIPPWLIPTDRVKAMTMPGR